MAELPDLIRILELNQEECIYIARNGTPIVEMKLIQNAPCKKRIGVAEGLFTVPDEFDRWDQELE